MHFPYFKNLVLYHIHSCIIYLLMLNVCFPFTNGPVHGFSVLITSASCEGADESGHMRRQARAFAVLIHNYWMYMMAQSKT